ncbi:MAG: TIM barrel protein [Pseudoruegeria sp.]
MLGFSLNQVTMSEAPLNALLETAVHLGCVGVELRNDLGRPVFDGMKPDQAGTLVRDHGIRLLGLSQVYPFNRWSDEIENEVKALIEIACDAGAETISLIPCNDGSRTDKASRSADLMRALDGCLPLLEEAGLVALIEPVGFERSSLRLKSELAAAIVSLDAQNRVKIVHDTFHHTLAGEGAIYPELTGIVHASGIIAPAIPIEQMKDDHRVLVNVHDRLGNLDQIDALANAGYTGLISFECFAREVRNLADPLSAISQSIDFISTRAQQKVA